MAKVDIYEQVTQSLIAQLEAGAGAWQSPFTRLAASGIPLRWNGEEYRGINVLLLWQSAAENRFSNPHWMTFKQALDLGGAVRKGERGTRIIFYKTLTKEEETASGEIEETRIPMLRHYTVFNCSQIDGLPDKYQTGAAAPYSEFSSEPLARLTATNADIRRNGDSAYYHSGADYIMMPHFDRFMPPAGNDLQLARSRYVATLAHELCHWTGHKSRLDRNMRIRTTAERAQEELIAEIGAAFLGARLGILGDHFESHAAYLQSWLKALRDDKRFIFRAAAAAQAAADYILPRAATEEPATIAETLPAPATAGQAEFAF